MSGPDYFTHIQFISQKSSWLSLSLSIFSLIHFKDPLNSPLKLPSSFLHKSDFHAFTTPLKRIMSFLYSINVVSEGIERLETNVPGAMDIIWGMKFAYGLGGRSIIVEGDCLAVIQALRNKSVGSSSSTCLVLLQLLVLCNYRSSSQFLHLVVLMIVLKRVISMKLLLVGSLILLLSIICCYSFALPVSS
ncbi:uncharacterized protein LOC110684562 isoform X2 [Chenopodium quinoa]|uniref:uncharacterized protein LOC110684562 isoform X2 n=1 Tax=Chenopodium quinoa TaxID=63459 RepID=UPI000B7794FF|nr:uncharacterized protein LOC110684562 isoform X2 [Chenopodium quinoa]